LCLCTVLGRELALRMGAGILSAVGGLLALIVGLLLSATLIGAVCGVPLIVLGAVLWVYAIVRLMRYQNQRLSTDIANAIATTTTTPRGAQSYCSQCGAANAEGFRFCAQCGAQVT